MMYGALTEHSRRLLNPDLYNILVMLKPILLLGNSILRRKSSPIEELQSRDVENLIEDLSDTYHEAREKFGYGRGIAAPQIGELKRVVLIDSVEFTSPLINPRIVEASSRRFEVWDSCFCFDVAFFVLVDRHYRVKVEYFDHQGIKQVVDAEAKLSELLQHEIDHLNGVLAIDRMKDCRDIMMRSEWEKMRSQNQLRAH